MAYGPEAVAALQQGANEANEAVGNFDIAGGTLGEIKAEAGGIETEIGNVIQRLRELVIEKLVGVDERIGQAQQHLGSAATFAATAVEPSHPLLLKPSAIQDNNVGPCKEMLAATGQNATELSGILDRAITLAIQIKGGVVGAETHIEGAKVRTKNYQEELKETADRFQSAMEGGGA